MRRAEWNRLRNSLFATAGTPIMVRTARIALWSLVLAACAHASQGGPGGDPNLITQREIDSSRAITAYEAVQKLRGTFLSDRGKTTILGSSSSMPVVFLDGIRYGELQSLRNIAASQVATIRLYRAWEAQQKFGNGLLGGVIEVTTRAE